MQWVVTRNFEQGIFTNYKALMEYRCVNGDLEIVLEQAKVVKQIFDLYLAGHTFAQIKVELEKQKIKTATGKENWDVTTIQKMLKNEKYIGDALLQKTYTVDFMTKKRILNKGVVPQYYVEDDHEAVISKPLFYMVQEEMAKRASMNKSAVTRKKNQKSKYSAMYALTGKVICGECGYGYRRVTWARNGKKKIVWRCTERLENGVKNCKNSPTVPENVLNAAVMNAIQRIVQNEQEFVGAFRQNVIQVLGSYGGAAEPDEYDERIHTRQNEMLALIEENARQGEYNEVFNDKYRMLAEEIERLKKEQMEERRKNRLAENYKQRVKDMDHYLNTHTNRCMEYDDKLVRRLVSQVKILTADKIQIQFQSGIILEQELVYE